MKQDRIKHLNDNSDEVLSRDEMRQILGGNAPTCSCRVNLNCSVYDGGQTYYGECDANFGGGTGNIMPCGCSTQIGPYTPTSGQSHCCA